MFYRKSARDADQKLVNLDKENKEKLLHEEDLILRGDLLELSTVEDFRKAFSSSIFNKDLTI